LEENGENFHLLNRGITILAKALEYDNKTERARLRLHANESEVDKYGILDGGNTNEQINLWRGELDAGAREALTKRFVNLQVLVPRMGLTSDTDALLNDIKEARNNSVQVKQKSLADARHHFDLLKGVLAKESFFPEITWREGDKGSIDALMIVSLLVMFYPRFSEDAPDKEPNGAYGRKEKCLSAFLEYAGEEGEAFAKWIKFVPDLLRLFDEIQYSFPNFIGGRFGGIAEVRIFDGKKYEKGSKKYRKSPSKTTFCLRDMKYEYPMGWLYPLFAAFRVLLGENKAGDVVWKRDPFEFWAAHGEQLCARYEPHLKNVGNEPKKIATSALTYSAVRGALTDLYKDDLLAEAGISA